MLLTNAVEVAHVDDDKHLCLFCDASDKHFRAALTQISPADITKPVGEQHHEPLEFLSGTFRAACSRVNKLQRGVCHNVGMSTPAKIPATAQGFHNLM